MAVHKLLRIKISNANGTLKRNKKNHSKRDIFSVLQIFTAIGFMGDMDGRSLGKVQKKKSECRSQNGGKPFVLKNLTSKGLLGPDF